MIDLGFSGRKFTWMNLRCLKHMILECLDGYYSNVSWLESFPESLVKHLSCVLRPLSSIALVVPPTLSSKQAL